MSLIPAFAGIYQELASVNKNKICIVMLSIAKYPLKFTQSSFYALPFLWRKPVNADAFKAR